MKRIFIFNILLTIVFLNNFCFTQEKINLYFEASPNYSFKTFKAPPNITTDDQPSIGYTLSLKAGYWLSDKFQVLSGLEYNEKGFKTLFLKLDEQGNNISSFGTLHFSFIEIPVYAKYTFRLNKYQCSPVIGVSYGRLVGLKMTLPDQVLSLTKDQIKNSSFNRDAFNVHFGIESAYQLSKNIAIKIEPKLDYTVTDVLKGKGKIVKQHFYIFGCNVGIIVCL